MRTLSRIVLLSSIALILSACGGETSSTKALPAEDIKAIEALESQLFSELQEPKEDVAKKLMANYEQFAKEHPEHEQAPVYLDQSANIARSIFRDYKRGLACYEGIVEKYPDYDRIIDVKFFIAFMYDNELKDKAKAEEHYKAIAEQYPDHIFGRNAKDRLKTLHISDKELLEHWEKKNGQNREIEAKP